MPTYVQKAGHFGHGEHQVIVADRPDDRGLYSIVRVQVDQNGPRRSYPEFVDAGERDALVRALESMRYRKLAAKKAKKVRHA